MVKSNKKPVRATGKKVPLPKKAVSRKIWIRRIGAKQWVLLSTALFLLLILGFIGFNKNQIAQEKKQFDAAEAGLDSLRTDVIQRLKDLPISDKKIKSCSYASAKAERGRLGCSISIVMTYPAATRDDVRILANRTEEAVVNDSAVTASFSSINEDYYPEYNRYEAGTSFRFDFTDIQCSLRYYETQKDESPYPGYKLIMSCGGNPRSEIYPVKD